MQKHTLMINELKTGLDPRYIEQLLSIINRSMEGSHGTIMIFGSRARGNPRPASDIDLAIDTSETPDLLSGRLRENLENSLIPFTVDIVDLGSCDPVLAAEIRREGRVIWNG